MAPTALPTQRRRGRPYHLPVDPSPFADPTGGVNVRLAWLLGASRLGAADGAFANRRAFLPALVAETGVPCDESRISRWESGHSAVPPEVLAAYETVLAMPPGSLRALALRLAPALRMPADADNDTPPLDALLALVLTGEPVGNDWLTLTEVLAARPAISLEASTWSALCGRLIGELARATPLAALPRRAAVRRLLRHAVAQRHMADAIDEALGHPWPVRPAEVAALVQHAPDASARVVSLLGSGPDVARRGALRAAAALLAREAFAPAKLADLATLLVELLSVSRADLDLADVIHRLPVTCAWRVRHAAAGSPTLGLITPTGEIVDPAIADSVAGGLATAAQRSAPGALGTATDPMLERLVREALFHGHVERRDQSLALLRLSPYADHLAVAAAADLCDGAGQSRARQAALLRLCGSPRQLPVLVAAATGADPAVAAAALAALGDNPHRLTEAQARLVLPREAEPDLRLLDAALDTLGRHGHMGLALPLAQDTRIARRVEGRIAWWTEAGARVTR